jgi:hypothetical protein
MLAGQNVNLKRNSCSVRDEGDEVPVLSDYSFFALKFVLQNVAKNAPTQCIVVPLRFVKSSSDWNGHDGSCDYLRVRMDKRSAGSFALVAENEHKFVRWISVQGLIAGSVGSNDIFNLPLGQKRQSFIVLRRFYDDFVVTNPVHAEVNSQPDPLRATVGD